MKRTSNQNEIFLIFEEDSMYCRVSSTSGLNYTPTGCLPIRLAVVKVNLSMLLKNYALCKQRYHRRLFVV